MNFEMLMVIAQLCLTPTGSIEKEHTHSMQLRCQKAYIRCIENKMLSKAKMLQVYTDALRECVLEND